MLDGTDNLLTLAAGGPLPPGPAWLALIPLLPLLAAALCGVTMIFRVRNKLPAWIVVGALAVSFVLTLTGFLSWQRGDASHTQGVDSAQVTQVYEWIGVSWGDRVGQSLSAAFGFHMDGLSWLWMLFVTGLGTLIALYASEYMEHDVGKGYGRFFGAFALFVFSMACLVMGDNLVLLYLGWEGVGLCSYLLIGYFYKKPSAVAAAKKAFIVNRIGDLGLALGLFLIFTTFGSVQYDEIFRLVGQDLTGDGKVFSATWQAWVIPCLLMIGAFGKSAQFPLYVWLPDAMEGPTPVSALIHAATMVTAGVYLVARTMPLFLADPDLIGLTIVAWTGAFTAFLAATIGMAQFDIKRIMAYSTVSQLGYMFAGLGVLTTAGAAYHVFTHAFFKALLFLACGAVMHGFAGQLDLRKLSGLWKVPGWGIVSVGMLIGCLNLSGFPLTAGFFSKDMIIAESFVTPSEVIPGSSWIGWVLLLTAGLTAYYTFRVFFRVFMGPVSYEPGDEAHGHDDDHAHDHDHGSESHATSDHGHDAHEFHPHAPKWAINLVLAALALGSILAAVAYFVNTEHHGWVGGLVHHSSASLEGVHIGHAGDHAGHEHGAAHGSFLGMDPHKVMYYVSALVGFIGIGAAWWLHLAGRTEAATSRADALLPYLGPIPRWAQHKWYVDEFYDFLLRKPLLVLAHLFHLIDKLLVDGLVNTVGKAPGFVARSVRPSQSGILHGYATAMVGGLAIVLLLVLIVMGVN